MAMFSYRDLIKVSKDLHIVSLEVGDAVEFESSVFGKCLFCVGECD